jgi:uncharacterized ubiquitin-like protein YukD
MSHVAVTLELNRASKDLALPLDVTVRLLVESLLEAFHMKNPGGKRYRLNVKTEQGLRAIPLNATLADAGILHGTVLVLLLEDKKPEEHSTKTNAYLLSETGTKFLLSSGLTVLGRNDAKSGTFVDIDLKGLVSDPKIISRRHAQIRMLDGRFHLIDLASINGTKLNGQRLLPNEKHQLRDGDVIEFGRDGIQLKFVMGKSE